MAASSGGCRCRNRTRVGDLSFWGGAVYANASLFAKEILGLVGPDPSAVRWLIVDAEAITNVDYTAARALRQLHKELVNRGVAIGLARVAPSIQADLDRHHLTEVIGRSMIFARLHDAVAAFARRAETVQQPADC